MDATNQMLDNLDLSDWNECLDDSESSEGESEADLVVPCSVSQHCHWTFKQI